MKNNQINGNEHSQELKQLVQDHPTLNSIDFSNSDMNVNKNKLRNIGAIALVEGMLESYKNGCCLISDINLSYNYMTSECLHHFARLNNPDFIQLRQLNLSYNDLGPNSIQILEPVLETLTELSLANTKLTNESIDHLTKCFKTKNLCLEALDLHGNSFNSVGFFKLIHCLNTNNKVRSLNVSHNNIANDPKSFRMVQRFLAINKVLEVLDLSYCNITAESGVHIGKGLRGNRNLQKLVLKGNPLKGAVSDISKAFEHNIKALCIKELDLSKCQLECEHIDQHFLNMIQGEFTTLKNINLRDNFIKAEAGERIKDALKSNKTITQIQLDFNPIT